MNEHEIIPFSFHFSQVEGPLWFRTSAPGKGWHRHLNHTTSTERLNDNDFGLFGCSDSDFLNHILSAYSNTSCCFRSLCTIFLAVFQ